MNMVQVLLVEDNPDHARLIERMLGQARVDAFELTPVRRLSEGLAQLEGREVDVILLDLSLPDSQGLDTFVEMEARASQVPIVVLTGFEDEELAIEAARKGAQDYLVKNQVDSNTLARAIRYAIERKRAEEEIRRLYQASQEKSARLAALNAISAAAVSSLELDVVLQQTLEMSCQALDAADGSILLRDPDTQDLFFAVTLSDTLGDLKGHRLETGQGIAGWVAQRQQAIYVNDAQNDPRWYPGADTATGFETRSLMAAPLKHQGKVTGVLELVNKRQGAFGQEDLDLLEAVAGIVATALENARLFTATRSYADRLAQLHQFGLALSASLDASEVIHVALNQCQDIFRANQVLLLQADPETDDVYSVHALVDAASVDVSVQLQPGQGVTGWVMENRQPVLVQDVQDDPRYVPLLDQHLDHPIRSVIVAPLLVRDQVIGALEIASVKPGVYSRDELNTLQTAVSTLSVALENARLYQETSRRLAETRTLQKVILAATSTLDFDQVLDRAVQTIHRILDVERLSFVLPDGSGEHLVVHPSILGFESLSLDKERVVCPLDGSLCGQVYTRGEAMLLDGLAPVPYHCQLGEGAGSGSKLAVPVKSGERVIAILNAQSSRPAAFNQDDLRTFQAIAAHLGVVMENARLYEAEREQRKLLEQSQAQLVQSEKLAATGRLAASLAHEINNPLQAIHNGLQLMLNFPLDPDEQLEYVNMANEEVERLIDMVDRILNFARCPQQQMKPANLNDIVKRVLRLVDKYLQHSRIRLHRDLSPNLPLIAATPSELGQVFLNLIINAVEAMDKTGTLRISSHSDKNGRLSVVFADTGPGIPPEHLDRIFEPFFSTKAQGTGLGLSVSYNIVKRHQGEITVQSEPGQGATFTVWLPRLEQADENSPEQIDALTQLAGGEG